MALPPKTKVFRPDLKGTDQAERVGWIAPPGHYPMEYPGDFLDSVENPNAKPVLVTQPPDDSPGWVVVWWQGLRLPDGTRGPSYYAWEWEPWLEVLELPPEEQ